MIDVVVFRGSDALYGWLFDSLQALGLKLGAIALAAAGRGGWLALSTALGRGHERRAARLTRRSAELASIDAARRTGDHHARSSTPVSSRPRS